MTPEELRDRVGEYRELLDDLDNAQRLRREMFKEYNLHPQSQAIIEAQYGVDGHDTFTIPVGDLIPLIDAKINRILVKIGEIQ